MPRNLQVGCIAEDLLLTLDRLAFCGLLPLEQQSQAELTHRGSCYGAQPHRLFFCCSFFFCIAAIRHCSAFHQCRSLIDTSTHSPCLRSAQQYVLKKCMYFNLLTRVQFASYHKQELAAGLSLKFVIFCKGRSCIIIQTWHNANMAAGWSLEFVMFYEGRSCIAI